MSGTHNKLWPLKIFGLSRWPRLFLFFSP